MNQHDHTKEDKRGRDLNGAVVTVEIRPKSQGDNIPLLDSRAGYRANEDISAPSQHQTATVHKGSEVSDVAVVIVIIFHTRFGRDASGCDAKY